MNVLLDGKRPRETKALVEFDRTMREFMRPDADRIITIDRLTGTPIYFASAPALAGPYYCGGLVAKLEGTPLQGTLLGTRASVRGHLTIVGYKDNDTLRLAPTYPWKKVRWAGGAELVAATEALIAEFDAETDRESGKSVARVGARQ